MPVTSITSMESFENVVDSFKDFDIYEFMNKRNDNDVQKAIAKDKLNYRDFLTLLSPKAKNHLESMAQKSHKLTVQHFGKTMKLYTPLYISNSCSNECVYCGFRRSEKIPRYTMNMDEIEEEAKEIAKTGLKHILVLTGEDKKAVSVEYFGEVVKMLKSHFSSVSMETYPMDTEDYMYLKECGIDGLTIYQETYNKDKYKKVHLAGKKKDYSYRINTPERGAKAGLRVVGVGTLFGLGETKEEAFFSGVHAKYLQDKYIETEVNISIPRINAKETDLGEINVLDDAEFIQVLLAYRLFLPKSGITVSTRERGTFRDKLIPIGVTMMSAGSKTNVGGYTGEFTTNQFDISDPRSVDDMIKVVNESGYQPILKDWELPL